jgi:hypothetical protein
VTCCPTLFTIQYRYDVLIQAQTTQKCKRIHTSRCLNGCKSPITAGAGILEQSMGARNRGGIGLSYRPTSAGIFKQSMGAGDRVGIGLSYRPTSAGIFKQSMGARDRVGIGLSYRPARLHSLAESVPRNRFLASSKVSKFGLRLHRLAEWIPGLLKSLKIPHVRIPLVNHTTRQLPAQEREKA